MLGSDAVAALSSGSHDVLAPTVDELDITAAAPHDYPSVDAILNCAAYTAVDLAESEPEAAFRINADGAGRVADAAQTQSAKLIHISTDYVFDGTAKRPYLPEDPTSPLGAYGRSKLAGERSVGERGLIVRTAWLFGPNGKCFPRSVLRAWLQSHELRVVADQLGSPTYTGDLGRSLVQLLDNGPRSGIINVAGRESLTWHALAIRTCESWNRVHGKERSVQVWPIHTSEWPTPARRPAYSVLADCGFSGAMRILDAALDEFVMRLGDSV